jgi:hypothetical protein
MIRELAPGLMRVRPGAPRFSELPASGDPGDGRVRQIQLTPKAVDLVSI